MLMSSECTRTKRSALSPPTKGRGGKSVTLLSKEIEEKSIRKIDRGELDQEEDEQRTASGRSRHSEKIRLSCLRIASKTSFWSIVVTMHWRWSVRKLWARGCLDWMENKFCEVLNGMYPNPRVDIVCKEWSRTSSVDSACQLLWWTLDDKDFVLQTTV